MARYVRVVNNRVREVLNVVGNIRRQFHPDVADTLIAHPNAQEGQITSDGGATFEDAPDTRTLAQAKRQKLRELNGEFLSRVRTIYPSLNDIDEVKLVRDQFLSTAPSARQPTADFQKLIDTYQAAIGARTDIQALGNKAVVDAYDVANTPVWPA